ncbi:hypothetical protein SAMN05216456_1335 [Devosia crocina]|uniref:Uncharacterized protein n=1 Tax=Devosia crocina TaxID=429728 RepID=A0A1I7N9T5_9HYPH|nr:hypothetical protein SAMN05216456_1335 [Devosia crocina]
MSMTPSRRTIEAMTLGGMATDNRTIIVKCGSCRRTRIFLTADLVKVYGESQSPHTLFRDCSICGRPTRKGFGFPNRGDRICRPSVKKVWKWHEEAYEPVRSGPDLDKPDS